MYLLFHYFSFFYNFNTCSVSSKKETKYLCSARLEAKERSWQNQRKRRREAQKRKNENPAESGASKKSLLVGKFTEVSDVEAGDSNPSSCDLMQEALMQEILSSERGQKAVSNCETEDQDRDADQAGLVLVCDLTLRWTGSSLSLDLSYLDGEVGWEGVHQLVQFIKNKLASMS